MIVPLIVKSNCQFSAKVYLPAGTWRVVCDAPDVKLVLRSFTDEVEMIHQLHLLPGKRTVQVEVIENPLKKEITVECHSQ